MKISLKIFIFTYCIIVAVTVLGGFFLIDYEYCKSLDEAKKQAMQQNENLYTYVATMEELLDSSRAKYSLENLIERMNGEVDGRVEVGNYESLRGLIERGKADGLEHGQWSYALYEEREDVTVSQSGKEYIHSEEKKSIILQVTSRYEEQYIINYCDISDIVEHRDDNVELFNKIIILVSGVIAVVLYLFTWYITRPLSEVTQMANRLSEGDFGARINADYKQMKSYEVERLGRTLNLMAERTEQHIRETEEQARRKEEFMGNFAHEMKTPMTSIIGYADLLRSFDLDPEKRRQYSNFIYNEGKRVEQLSLNLLELIVLDKRDFAMSDVGMEEFFRQLREEVHFLGEKYQVHIHTRYEPAQIRMEKSLLLTAVLNLIDNACKATEGDGDVFVLGKRFADKYAVAIVDQGIGIPEEELEKITEPFYMVDKSRARKQGGAGLGLTLCRKIAALHGGELRISSKPGEGTRATLFLNMEKAVTESE